MKWNKKINDWANGIYQTYPNNIQKRFFYETSVCDKKMENEYNEIFIENNNLEKLKEDFTQFKEHIIKSKNKYTISFNNLSNDTILIIPIPKNNKNFTTLKDFIDNASKTQQIFF